MLNRSRSNKQKSGDVATRTIKLMEERLDTMEIEKQLTKSNIESVCRVSNDIKSYHLAKVDQLENDEEVELENEFTAMELIHRIGELVGEPFHATTSRDNDLLVDPHPSFPAPVTNNNHKLVT